MIVGRVTKKRDYGKVCFLEVFSEGSLHECILLHELTKDYTYLKQKIFRGACIRIFSKNLECYKTKKKVLKLVKDLVIESKPLKFPQY